MIDHIGIPVSDLEKSTEFYTRVLEPLGIAPSMRFPEAVGFGPVTTDGAGPNAGFWLSQGEVSSPRLHIAFRAKSEADVQAFHAAALRAGGRDNGAPGPRPHYHPGYYAAFVIDPNGYNIEAVLHTHGTSGTSSGTR